MDKLYEVVNFLKSRKTSKNIEKLYEEFNEIK